MARIKAIGRSEKVICICMVAMLAILFGATLLNENPVCKSDAGQLDLYDSSI